MKRIPLYAYVAHNNPQGALSVIDGFNLPRPTSKIDLVRAMRYIMSTKGEEGFVEIAKVHPDKNLILDVHSEESNVEEKSNCSGGCSCSGKKSNACGSGYSNVEGLTPKTVGQSIPVEEMGKSEKVQGLTREDIAAEIKKFTDKNTFIKDALPYIAVGGVAYFVVRGILKG